jgi:hypothetical protein
MSLYYHDCGYPIDVWAYWGRHGEAAMFDGRTRWNDHQLSVCPQCGQQLHAATLHDRPPVPTGILAGYLLTWPFNRRRLEACLVERRQRDRRLDVLQAQQDLAALERALNRVAALAAQLDDPVLGQSDDQTVLERRAA